MECPVGTAPRLPYQLWVTYADGHKEYRQVRWENAALATEEAEATLPAGTDYTVQGFITGDLTTAQGLPVEAAVHVTAAPYAVPAAAPVAEPLPLNCVHLTGDNRLATT